MQYEEDLPNKIEMNGSSKALYVLCPTVLSCYCLRSIAKHVGQEFNGVAPVVFPWGKSIRIFLLIDKVHASCTYTARWSPRQVR